MEQQVIPTLVVSHVSILQCLMAYFRNTPIENCMSIEVPMHTVIKFEPARGGGFLETQHRLGGAEKDGAVVDRKLSDTPDSQHSNGNNSSGQNSPRSQVPIWGDHIVNQNLPLGHLESI